MSSSQLSPKPHCDGWPMRLHGMQLLDSAACLSLPHHPIPSPDPGHAAHLPKHAVVCDHLYLSLFLLSSNLWTNVYRRVEGEQLPV